MLCIKPDDDQVKQPKHVVDVDILVIQGVPGGKDLTSGERSLGQTIPI